MKVLPVLHSTHGGGAGFLTNMYGASLHATHSDQVRLRVAFRQKRIAAVTPLPRPLKATKPPQSIGPIEAFFGPIGIGFGFYF